MWFSIYVFRKLINFGRKEILRKNIGFSFHFNVIIIIISVVTIITMIIITLLLIIYFISNGQFIFHYFNSLYAKCSLIEQ